MASGIYQRFLANLMNKIVDLEGWVVPCGTPGELLTRGYCVMPGYWQDTERTASTIDTTHWIKTGDTG